MFVLYLAVTQLQFTAFLGITLGVDWGRKQFTMTAFGLWALQVPLMMLLVLKSDRRENSKKTLCLSRKAVGQDTQARCPQGCGNVHRAFPVFRWSYPLGVHQTKLRKGECPWEYGSSLLHLHPNEQWVSDQFT